MLGGIGRPVLEFQECLWYIFKHVEVNGAGGIVSVDVDAAKEGAVPVHCNGVVFFKGSLEMENMFAQGGFNYKIINYKAEDDVTPDVAL